MIEVALAATRASVRGRQATGLGAHTLTRKIKELGMGEDE